MEFSNASDTSPTADLPHPPKMLLGLELYQKIAIFTAAATFAFACMGWITNIINIIVYYKIGLTTPSNICYFILAVSDIVSIVWIFIATLGTVVGPRTHPYLHISPRDIGLMLSTIFFSSSSFSSWVTTILSLERSCCIVFPLKVKLIFTRKTVKGMLLAMFVYQVAVIMPYFVTYRLTSVTSPATNWTRVVFRVSSSKENQQISMITKFCSFSVPTMICFVIVTIATTFLIIHFKRSRKDRAAMLGKDSTDKAAAAKDARLIKSVILVCLIYIVGYFLTVALFIANLILPALIVFDPYLGTFTAALFHFSFLLQVISCSVNIFVYLRMNTKYYNTFKGLMGCVDKGAAKT